MARGQTIGAMVFNKPQLIALDSFQPIVSYLSNPERATSLRLTPETPDEGELKLEDFNSEREYQNYKLGRMGINPKTMVGTLNVEGALMYRSGSIGADCTELTSYEGLKQQAEDMIDAGVKRIVLKVDSGGGMAYGMFSASNYIKKLARQAGVHTVAYVDGSSYSAAYGLSVLADEIVVNPQASVGSVGVVVSLYNDSKMLEKAGVSRQFVYAGDNKIPFDNATGEFTDKFLTDLQKSVDKTYNSFVKHIAKHRGISEQTVIDTQASTFDAEEALELGLADKIMELEDFEIEYGLKAPKMKNTSFTSMATNSDSSQQPIADGNLTKEGIMSKQIDAQEAPKTDELLSDAHATNTEAGSPEMKNDLTAKLSVLEKENTELSTQLSELNKQLQSYESQVEELTSLVEKKELAYRTAQRQAKLEDALGKDNDKVLELVKTTESLSDEQFEIIAQSLAGSQVAKQEELKEFGGEGQEANVQLSLAEQIKKTAETMNRKA